jgi:hypothetical protein
MSSTAAHINASAPSGVLAIPRSVRILASTGNAVTLIETARNNANARKPTLLPKSGYKPNASPMPVSIGSAMLTWLTVTAVNPRLRNEARSISEPTMNMKKISPSCASVLIVPTTSAGNSQRNASGQIKPSSEGPSSTPAMISPMTAG